MRSIRIGSGAAYGYDRIDPAIEMAENGNVQYICLECLAERTIAIAQLAKRKDPKRGYGELFEERMEAILPYCAKNKLIMISNIGAANPYAGLEKIIEISEEIGAKPLKVAAIKGDDVLDIILKNDERILETGEKICEIRKRIISANAYLGIEAILPALEAGANVIIAGRVADPSLFLAPIVYGFGWSLSDWERLGTGTAVGHLLECGAQVTGGVFADPGYKEVPGLADIGFPIAEVYEDGSFVVTKTSGSGGLVSVATCKEQLLYEIHDPSAYLTPDVAADFSKITLNQVGPNKVLVKNASGRRRPDNLKVSVALEDGYIGEGEISYGGTGALARTKLAEGIILERIIKRKISCRQLKTEIIGYNSLLGPIAERTEIEPFEARLRVAARVESEREAKIIGDEVDSLLCNGPAGGAGLRKYSRPVIAVSSTFIPRNIVKIEMQIKEVS